MSIIMQNKLLLKLNLCCYPHFSLTPEQIPIPNNRFPFRPDTNPTFQFPQTASLPGLIDQMNRPRQIEPFPARPVQNTPFPARPIQNDPFSARPIQNDPFPARPVQTDSFPARPDQNEPFKARPVENKPFPKLPGRTEPFPKMPGQVNNFPNTPGQIPGMPDHIGQDLKSNRARFAFTIHKVVDAINHFWWTK